jgi:hypothetical protein
MDADGNLGKQWEGLPTRIRLYSVTARQGAGAPSAIRLRRGSRGCEPGKGKGTRTMNADKVTCESRQSADEFGYCRINSRKSLISRIKRVCDFFWEVRNWRRVAPGEVFGGTPKTTRETRVLPGTKTMKLDEVAYESREIPINGIGTSTTKEGYQVSAADKLGYCRMNLRKSLISRIKCRREFFLGGAKRGVGCVRGSFRRDVPRWPGSYQ